MPLSSTAAALADANIVLLDSTTVYWTSKTKGKTSKLPLRLCLQSNNNLVAYDSSNAVFWSSDTFVLGRPAPNTLWIQNDGNLVLYDATCAPYWSALKTPRVQPATRPPYLGAETVTLPASMTLGPYGGGDPNGSGVFDDTALAVGGTNQVTQVDVSSGSWIDAIRITYGGTPTPWRGGGGQVQDGNKDPLKLAKGEFITRAFVRSGAYVDEIRFVTSQGRYWSTSGDTSSAGDMGALASPCPDGAYK